MRATPGEAIQVHHAAGGRQSLTAMISAPPIISLNPFAWQKFAQGVKRRPAEE
ncbi:MAG: hypothetical protein MZV63_00285 [Marinilabiliales bacterium]|nr:hypothetical protein [Marinilabiliales bacterium]